MKLKLLILISLLPSCETPVTLVPDAEVLVPSSIHGTISADDAGELKSAPVLTRPSSPLLRYKNAVLMGAPIEFLSGYESKRLTGGDGGVTPMTLKAWTARASGFFALTNDGLFYESNGHLLQSPLNDSFSMTEFFGLSVVGEGDSEELWLVSKTQIVRVKNLVSTSFSIDEMMQGQPIEFAMASAPGVVLVVSKGRVFSLESANKKLTLLTEGIGTVTEGAKLGTEALLATSTGLLSIVTGKKPTLFTFVSDGTGKSVQALAVNSTDVYVVVDGILARRSAPQLFSRLASVGAVSTGSLSTSSRGVLYVNNATAVMQIGTPSALSFEQDIKPLMHTECMVCHNGTSAEMRNLENLDYVKSRLANTGAPLLSLLNGTASPAMPPVSGMNAEQFDFFSRWVDGGTAP